ncbi:MAG TPA: sugar ABC transporter permease [Candidatus Limiplasma sp.]|nr:sugar ABC transporter permease [Candidatus Limiplasma sp.]
MRNRRSVSKLAVKENATGYFFIAPWLIGLFVFTLFPMGMSFYLSFTDYSLTKGLDKLNWIGLDNYVRMFANDPEYIKSLLITLKYVILSVPMKLAFALIIAMVMNQKLRLISLYRAIYYIPTLLGGSIAISVVWRRLFHRKGPINEIIGSIANLLGLEHTAKTWYTDPNLAIYTLIILTVWQFGSSMIIFLAGLKQIPQDYYEAAAVDGATPIQRFFFITLPSLSPVILFNLIMQTINAFQAFTQAYVIGGGGNSVGAKSMEFYTLYLYKTGWTAFKEMGYASAMAWVLLVIIGLTTVLIFKTSGSWVNYGSGE